MEKITELVKNNSTEISKGLCIVFVANNIVTSPIRPSINHKPLHIWLQDFLPTLKPSLYQYFTVQ